MSKMLGEDLGDELNGLLQTWSGTSLIQTGPKTLQQWLDWKETGLWHDMNVRIRSRIDLRALSEMNRRLWLELHNTNEWAVNRMAETEVHKDEWP